jgi:Tol biopolymer transport system component
MVLTTGTRIGPYEITAPIGAGGMGEVYRATDTKLKRDVAIKVLPGDFAQDRERLARFEREAHLLASLNHPNIASIYGLEESEGNRCLVMELVEGETLARRLERGPFPVDEALPVARQITSALEAAHEKGTIHRDLKPANVMIAANGTVKVLDFGLAKALRKETSVDQGSDMSLSPTITLGDTRAGMIIGTAAYMSPEQARGKQLDKRTDIWSFGCLLYECLTGNPAFPGDTVTDTLSAILQNDPDWSALPSRTPPRVRDLLERCLEKGLGDRLRDSGDAGLELDRAVAGKEWTAAAEPVTARPRSAPRWLAGVAMILLGLAIGIGLGLLRPSSRIVGPAKLRTLTYSGRDWGPAASPDGRLIAFTSDRDGRPRIWIKQLSGGGEEALTDGPDSLPRFSPDGSTLLFLRNDGSVLSVYRQSLVGGQTRKLVENAREAAWSPDGQQVAFIRRPMDGQHVIGVADAQDGSERLLAEPGVAIYGLRWSPGGDTIVAVADSVFGTTSDDHLILVDAQTGQVESHRLELTTGPISSPVWNASGELIFARAGSPTGDYGDALSRVVRYNLQTSSETTLFWAEDLFPTQSFRNDSTRIDVVRSETLVFHQEALRQTLRLAAVQAGTFPHRGQALTSGHGRDRQPVYSPDGKRILFTSNRSGHMNLWMLTAGTGSLLQITDAPVLDVDPAFTPDGRKIVWSSNRTGHMEIWICNVDGSGARQITTDGINAENPTATADGEWIVYWSASPDNAGLWKVRPDGRDPIRVFDLCMFPDTSPDGRFAACLFNEPDQFRTLIHVIDLEKREKVSFLIEVPYTLQSDAVTIGRLRWLPDGTGIAYVGVDEQNRTGVYAQDFVPGENTTHTRRKLAGFSPDFITESFGLSPDGSQIVLAILKRSRRVTLAEDVAGVEPRR